MIGAYAKAGEVFKNKEYIDAAAKAAGFLLKTMQTKDGRLLRLYAAAPGEKHSAKGNAYLDDYAYLIHGLLNLHDATGDNRWLDEAKALSATIAKWHGDAERGGFFFTAHDHEKLFARAKDAYDGAQPSGNGIQANNLLRLAKKSGEVEYRDSAFRTIKIFLGVFRTNPASVPGLARALDDLLDIAEKDPTAIAPKKPVTPAPVKAPRESADVVKAELKSVAAAGGAQTFTLTLTIADPWHIYASPVGNDMLKTSETKVEVLVDGKPVEAAIEFPKGTVAKDKLAGDYRIYEGAVKLTGKLPRGPNDGELEIRVRVIACKEGICLLPSVIKLAAK
jgi:hypothetical protein